MRRVLFVSTSSTVGGAEKTLFSLATLLDPARFGVAGVVSLKPAGAYLEKLSRLGAQTHCLKLTGRPGWRHLRELSQIISQARPDVVCALMYQAIQLCRLAKRRLRGKTDFHLVSSPRVSYRTRSWPSLLVDRTLKGQDDLLIAESQATRDHLVGRLGYAEDRVKVLYNGVDLTGLTSAKLERERKRLELGIREGEILLGTAGRLDRQKGHAFLLDAMARLKHLPLRLLILGEGPLRADLEGRLRRLGLEGRVLMPGEKPEALAWLSALDAFVLPSLWEGLPNALLEAMALGLPCLACRVDGVGEVVQDGQNGLLVGAADGESLARRIAELAGDEDLRLRLGRAAEETIRRRFSLPRMIAEYEAAYDEALSRPIR